ncbi:MAG TPA: hypothetical protein VJQ86_10225, partial [Rhodanobacteraceae bacterium]|nr:hypothetical protein [Rhodanobacteraceae bacterium]
MQPRILSLIHERLAEECHCIAVSALHLRGDFCHAQCRGAIGRALQYRLQDARRDGKPSVRQLALRLPQEFANARGQRLRGHAW